MTGQVGYHAGASAEQIVARNYQARGCEIRRSRFRGKGGEIDLIAQDGDQLVFIEVKKSKSHQMAALRLGAHQIARLFDAASEFLGGEPDGQQTHSRFDVALVNQIGQVEIVENALSA